MHESFPNLREFSFSVLLLGPMHFHFEDEDDYEGDTWRGELRDVTTSVTPVWLCSHRGSLELYPPSETKQPPRGFARRLNLYPGGADFSKKPYRAKILCLV
jgi:hypothetical protein